MLVLSILIYRSIEFGIEARYTGCSEPGLYLIDSGLSLPWEQRSEATSVMWYRRERVSICPEYIDLCVPHTYLLAQLICCLFLIFIPLHVWAFSAQSTWSFITWVEDIVTRIGSWLCSRWYRGNHDYVLMSSLRIVRQIVLFRYLIRMSPRHT